MSRSVEGMDEYRARKFAEYGIRIEPENRTEIRGPKNDPQEINFTHAVYASNTLVGRACTPRSALKRAHQWVRDHRR